MKGRRENEMIGKKLRVVCNKFCAFQQISMKDNEVCKIINERFLKSYVDLFQTGVHISDFQTGLSFC